MPTAPLPFTADVTLFAQWTAQPSFTVTFNNNGGTGAMATEMHNVPTALTPMASLVLASPSLDGTRSRVAAAPPMPTGPPTPSLPT